MKSYMLDLHMFAMGVKPTYVSVDFKENLKYPVDKFFTLTAKCRNCKDYKGGIIIPRGTVVKDHEPTLECDNCGVTGMISIC
jgi:hypothetical protein